MPLFMCRECGCVENTALGNYWWPVAHDNKPPQCSECSDGEWHGHFPKRSAKGFLVDSEGFIWRQGEVDSGFTKHTKIIGIIK